MNTYYGSDIKDIFKPEPTPVVRIKLDLKKIHTDAEIEAMVRQFPTSRRRINAKKKLEASNLKLKKEANAKLDDQIAVIRREVRLKKISGARECDVRGLYSDITQLEIKKWDI